jgi:hypothetical protein
MTADLIARLEAATEGSRALDEGIAGAIGWAQHDEMEVRADDNGELIPTFPVHGWLRPDGSFTRGLPMWSRSLDAADALRDADRFPILIVQHLGPVMGCGVRIGAFDTSDGEARPVMLDASARTEALARCIAALKARSAP